MTLFSLPLLSFISYFPFIVSCLDQNTLESPPLFLHCRDNTTLKMCPLSSSDPFLSRSTLSSFPPSFYLLLGVLLNLVLTTILCFCRSRRMSKQLSDLETEAIISELPALLRKRLPPPREESEKEVYEIVYQTFEKLLTQAWKEANQDSLQIKSDSPLRKRCWLF